MQTWAAYSSVRSLYIAVCKPSPYRISYRPNPVGRCHTAIFDIQRLVGSVRTYRLRDRNITTVDPNKLTSDCFQDFSGQKFFGLRVQESAGPSTSITLWQRKFWSFAKDGTQVHARSPPGTHGFFYYRAPPPWAGEIRFRITKDRNPSSFPSGHDFLLRGMPWAVTLLFATPVSAFFHNILLRDGLLSEGQIRRLESLEPWQSRLAAKSHLVHSIGQPFALPLGVNRSTSTCSRHIVPGIVDSRDVLERFEFRSVAGSLWGYDAGPNETRVFSKNAIAIVHLEPWVHPRKKQRRLVALRIRRLLHYDGLPACSPDDHPDYGAAGHLLRSLVKERGRVWYHDLDRGPVAWRHLRLPPESVTMDL
ncbi:uncharacterized protein PHACADRAFT_179653 [Phanerochaete carnosa HHB-10118-sp]|uniref:Uncharacterized protein n=1 Tax=Phanerochaete carnosa (strain HHB-10118-sp) TaxID=650164 RepID=K5WLM3_PHACS|nr:uncharacterized protein PHACADRAFT_179653 [Phanerochaete carnosa HHB-10118-sp]EKM60300.1 hypothetical protein PHACADRAFT_179653 [Phanerochaete carnosa HHB-10118-sp]